jgi:biotin carboxylase
MTKLVMVMPYLDYLPKARQEGFHVYAIWDPAVADRIFGAGADAYLADLAATADVLHLTDFDDAEGFEAVLRKAVAEYQPDHLYHVGSEDTMLAAYRIAEELGLAVNPASSIRALNDKVALREVLAQHGLSPVRFAHATRWQDVPALLDGFTLPVVVKPTGLSGSRGVMLVHNRADLADWGALLDSYEYTGPVLVEEYLRGPEFSVETMSVRGTHHVIGVTRKVLGPPPLFVETGHIHPEPPSPETTAMTQLVVDTLTATGYQTGPTHTEVILTPAGPRIVESQARLGGDRIPYLVALSSGVDLIGSIFRAVAGRPLDPATGTDTARIHYFDLPRGVVRAVHGVAEARALDFVRELSLPFKPGDVIPETVDWRTRHGYVIVSGRSAEHTLEQVRQVESLLRVDVTEASGAPTESALVGGG